jgi:hypothetical protein
MTSAPIRPEARAPRGFADRRARDLVAERRILAAVSEVYERYGFEALDTSALEYADALGKFLPDADRPNDGVFALLDDDEQWMALRYDLTAPLARFAAQNWETLPKPFRRYAFGTVWRNEKPGPGRYREFTQCDADRVGSARPEADAEIIAMAAEGLGAAGLPPGAFVSVKNCVPRWCRVTFRGLTGWMSSAYIARGGQRYYRPKVYYPRPYVYPQPYVYPVTSTRGRTRATSIRGPTPTTRSATADRTGAFRSTAADRLTPARR